MDEVASNSRHLSSHSLEARSLKSRHWQDWSLPEVQRKSWFHASPSSWWLTTVLGVPGIGATPTLASIFTWHRPLCVCLCPFSFYKDICHLRSNFHLSPVWPHLYLIASVKTLFPSRVALKVLKVQITSYLLGIYNSTHNNQYLHVSGILRASTIEIFIIIDMSYNI